MSTFSPESPETVSMSEMAPSPVSAVPIKANGVSPKPKNEDKNPISQSSRQNYIMVFGARTGFTLVSMKSKHYSQGGRGYQQIRGC